MRKFLSVPFCNRETHPLERGGIESHYTSLMQLLESGDTGTRQTASTHLGSTSTSCHNISAMRSCTKRTKIAHNLETVTCRTAEKYHTVQEKVLPYDLHGCIFKIRTV